MASKSDYVAADERMPFNHQHLALVEAQLRSNSIDPYVRSIIKLLRVTGCRPMEIAGLTRADVFLDEPTPWVWIRNNGVRRLKTNTSQRRIPVLPEVVTDLRALSAAADGHDAPLGGDVEIGVGPLRRIDDTEGRRDSEVAKARTLQLPAYYR